MTSLAQIAILLLDVVKFFIIIKLVMSWLINFQVLNIHQPLVYQLYTGLQRMMEPLYAPIRRFVPNLGGIDITPMILLIIIISLKIVIENNFLYG